MNSDDWVKLLEEEVTTAARFGLTRDEMDEVVSRAGQDLIQRLFKHANGNTSVGLSIVMSLCQVIIQQGSAKQQRDLRMMLLMYVRDMLFDDAAVELISEALVEKADRIDGIWRRGANAESAKMLRILAMTLSKPPTGEVP
jgi:hypothetical protein